MRGKKWNWLAFDKERFIADNGRFLYGKLRDFLISEIDADFTEDFMFLITCKNVTDFRYEVNQYSFSKHRGSSKIVIIDEISKAHGVETTFEMEAEDLVWLIHHRDVW